jgi:uncharacterized protein YbaR (Trm112 family)
VEGSVLPTILLELLVDPEDKQPLWYFADKALLFNERTKRTYPVRNNIPVLLVSEARALDDDEVQSLTSDIAGAILTGTVKRETS